MKIVLNQLLPVNKEPEVNFAAIETAVQQNAAAGAKLCVFPEDLLYGVMRDRADLVYAGKLFGTWVNRFSQLARKYEVDLVPGSLPRYAGGNVFNTAVYIDKTGKILTRYAKHNLWLDERDALQSSNEPLRVFESAIGPAAVIICWDLIDRHLFEAAVQQGAKWIICPAFWTVNASKDQMNRRGPVQHRYGKHFSSSRFLDDLAAIRALEYNVGILVCNFAAIHAYTGRNHAERAISAGRTLAVTPYKRLYRKLNKRSPGTLLVDVDLDDVDHTLADVETMYGRRSDIAGCYPRPLR